MAARPLIEAVGDYIEQAGIAFYNPRDGQALLTIEVMPDSPTTVVMVNDTGSWSPDKDTPALEPTCQVRTRGPTFQVAHDLAWAVFDLLHAKNDLPLGADYRVLSCFGMQSPMSMGRNDDGTSEFSVNFEFRLYRLG